MKTQMRLKTSDRSLFEENAGIFQIKHKKNRLLVCNRFALCAVLISVLAASGYAGTNRRNVPRMTAAPVVSRMATEDEYAQMSFEDIEEKLNREREMEMSILDSVISDPNTDEEARKSAQKQVIGISKRMNMETEIRAALSHMGYEQIAAICAEERTVLIVPLQYADNQNETVRMIDAVTAISGVEAKDVKIILVKK